MSAFVLKIAAMLSMLTDHIGLLFLNNNPAWRIAGRIAFPLYSFMIVEGCRHVVKTEARMKRYLFFLGILAVLSEPFYDYAFAGCWFDWVIQNQIMQYFLFAAAYMLAERTYQSSMKILIWAVLLVVNFDLQIGYWSAGIVVMLLFMWYLNRYEDRSLLWRFGTMTCIMALFFLATCVDDTVAVTGFQPFFPVLRDHITGSMEAAVIYRGVFLAVPFLALYNGTYGRVPKWFRTLYLYFYPVHLMLLGMLKEL